MQLPWFKRIGLFIMPITVAGWLILITALVYTGYSFIEFDSRSHSVSDTLRPFIIRFLFIASVYYFIAWLASKTLKD